MDTRHSTSCELDVLFRTGYSTLVLAADRYTPCPSPRPHPIAKRLRLNPAPAPVLFFFL